MTYHKQAQLLTNRYPYQPKRLVGMLRKVLNSIVEATMISSTITSIVLPRMSLLSAAIRVQNNLHAIRLPSAGTSAPIKERGHGYRSRLRDPEDSSTEADRLVWDK